MFDYTKLPQLNLIHSVYIGMLSSSVIFLHHVLRLFVFWLCLFYFQPLFFNTCQKVINGVGWLDDPHCPSPILCDTVTLFIYTDLGPFLWPKNLIIWLYFSETMTFYDQTKMAEVEHTITVQRNTTSENRHKRCWSCTETNSQNMSKTCNLVWTKLKTCINISLFFVASRTYICKQCIKFHSRNLVHVRFCQHLQGVQVGSICRMQLRPSDVVVSPYILRFL